jgi:RimJ/RimL family protein N-acetyltransferase
MNSYKILNKQEFSEGDFKIVPIRYEDRFLIMKWRNEQIYHLRQGKPLTEKDQENYFTNTVPLLFKEDEPNQLLFSYLKDGVCIGYGGLVHLNWIDQNAEISFIMNTELETDYFKLHWTTFVSLLEEVAFSELKFHKIFTYAFDIRPHLYEVLESLNYIREATFKEHCLFEGEYKDVVIHSKIKIIK